MNFKPAGIQLLFAILTCFIYETNAQGVHPQNLFDTGVNMGYLTGHKSKGIDQEGAPIWAGNASAEWLSSWVPGAVTPITPSLEQPDLAHESMLTAMRGMAGCPNAYFNLRLSFYQLGYTMGRAVVETGYNCSNCMRQEMQKAAIEMRTIGQLLTLQTWQDLSAEINARALGIDVTLTGALASQQNAGYFGYLQSVLDQLNQLLPDELMLCRQEEETVEKPKPEPGKPEVHKDEKKKRNRQMYITGGYTGAKLHGETGTDSQPGDGFYIGFDLTWGDPVFVMAGVDFFRNSAGEEFFIPYIFQGAAPGEYMQGFRLHLGLGAHAVNNEKFDLSVIANLRLLSATSIDGNLTSIGDAIVESRAAHFNLGTYMSFGYFTVHTSYELGLTPILVLDGEDMKYKMWNLGLGVRF